MIIAIDGPAGAGKSTVARGLARRLNFKFMDTGAMYRAVGLAALEKGVDLDSAEELAAIAANINLHVDGIYTSIDGRDVTQQIRGAEVSAAASRAAAIPQVREQLVRLQRQIASSGNYVCEGRDQGSIVFPQAEFKFFITASVEGRARRRWQELLEQDTTITLEQVIEEQKQRDERDSNRVVGALVKADDAIEVRTDAMSIDEVIDFMFQIIHDNLRLKKSTSSG